MASLIPNLPPPRPIELDPNDPLLNGQGDPSSGGLLAALGVPPPPPDPGGLLSAAANQNVVGSAPQVAAPDPAAPSAQPAPSVPVGTTQVNGSQLSMLPTSGKGDVVDHAYGGMFAAMGQPIPNEMRPFLKRQLLAHIGSALGNGGTVGDGVLAAQKGAIETLQQGIGFQQARRLQAAIGSLSDPNERLAAMANLPEFGKALAANYGPTTLRQGETVEHGQGGPTYTAPVFGLDPVSGRPYMQTTAGTTTGPTLGGGASIDPTSGALLDSRNNQVLGAVSHYQSNPKSNADNFSTSTFTPYGAASGPPSPPQLGAPGGAPQPGSNLNPPLLPPPPPASGQTRADRNNNPGNLKALSKGTWQGQTGVDPGGFVQFAKPEDGLRAAGINLANKQRLHGLKTIGDIIAAPKVGWDPGNTAYANAVAGQLGMKATDNIDLSKPENLGAMARAIFAYESGRPASGSGAESASRSPMRGPPANAPTVGGGTITQLSPGTGTQILSPAESQANGAPPGVILQRDVQGNLTPVVPRAGLSLPPDDQSYLNSLKEAASKSAMLAGYARQFIQLQAKSGQATGGYHAIPGETSLEGAFNPTMNNLGQLQKTMIPLQREIGSGPIRMGEIKGPDGGIWGGDVPRVESPAASNQFAAKQWTNRAQQLTSQANFYDQWAQSHGTLNGAQAAWQAQNGGSTFRGPQNAPQKAPQGAAGQPARLDPTNPDVSFAALPRGARFIGPDGKTRVKQ
jgi:hypothetical protein